ncbi:MAG TPA: thiamine phosphate synthase [Thermodesulfovibrionales bacterium]|nr:thiamine phosphate synthase [Thermodesulfovibrionales bacterium]
MKAVNSHQSSVISRSRERRAKSKKQKIEAVDFNLYLITDRKLFTDNHLLFTAVEEALKGGSRAVQLREKDLGTRDLLDMAYKMKELTRRYGAKLFINDRVDIALAVGADGVQLGKESIPAHVVRKTFQDKFIICVSTHSLDEAFEAERGGADFITLGPVYHTPSKMKYGEPIGIETLEKVKAKISIPVFAIGGIKLDKVREVKEAGADGVALISAILTAENIRETTEGFLRLLT